MNIKTKEFIANLKRCVICNKYLRCEQVLTNSCKGILCRECPLTDKQDGSYDKNTCSCEYEDYYNEILQLREEVMLLRVELSRAKDTFIYVNIPEFHGGPYGR